MLKRLLFLGVMVLSLSLIGCSESSNTVDDSGSNKKIPTFTVNEAEIPETITKSNNPNLLPVVSMISSFESLKASSLGFFVVPDQRATHEMRNDTTIVTHTTGVGTVTVKYYEGATENYWGVWITGDLGNGPVTNFKYMDATESVDKKRGTFKVYDFVNAGAYILTMNWDTDAAGKYTSTIEFGSGGELTKIIYTLGADKSGTMKMWTATVLTYDILWNANGAGSYVVYDPDTGAEVAKGTFPTK